MKKPELLLPAGSLDRLKTAFMYGADAVYCGLPSVSLRAKSAFTMADLKEGILYAHERGKKVYLTMNLFTHNSDIPRLTECVQNVKAVKTRRRHCGGSGRVCFYRANVSRFAAPYFNAGKRLFGVDGSVLAKPRRRFMCFGTRSAFG